MCFGFLCSRVPIFVFSCFVSMTCRRTRVLLPPSLWVVLLTFLFPLIFPSVYVLSYFCVCVFMCVCVCLFVLLFNSFTLNRSLPPLGSGFPSFSPFFAPVCRCEEISWMMYVLISRLNWGKSLLPKLPKFFFLRKHGTPKILPEEHG